MKCSDSFASVKLKSSNDDLVFSKNGTFNIQVILTSSNINIVEDLYVYTTILLLYLSKLNIFSKTVASVNNFKFRYHNIYSYKPCTF